MNTKIISVLLLSLTLVFNIDAQSRRSTGKSAGKSRTTATAKKPSNKKTTAQQSPIATLTALLEKKDGVVIKNLADLNKELAWAKAIEEKVGDKIKSGIRKQPDGKFVANGSMRALGSDVERYYDVIEQLGNHISGLRKYNQSDRDMLNGMMVRTTFIDFLLLQHINDILAMLPDDASKNAFKATMVSMFDMMANFGAYYDEVNHSLGLVGMGYMAQLSSAGNSYSIANCANDFLYQLWDNMKGDGSKCFDTQNEYLEKIQTLFSGAIAESEFKPESDECRQVFGKSANQFIDLYNKWLSSYPNHNSKVDSTVGMLFKNWYNYVESDLKELSDIDIVAIMRKAEQENRVYAVCDQAAAFPGGQSAMFQWISQNISYPADANGAGGRVMVEFIVEKDGSVSDAKIIRGGNEALDAEAIRLVSSMPKWIPGQVNGNAVRSRTSIPLTFRK